MVAAVVVFLAICLLQPNQVSSFGSCGQRSPSSRVVGGSQAQQGSWPWQIELLISRSPDLKSFVHRCGGTLIDLQWVVTAAHCVFMFPTPEHYKVVVGQIHRAEVKEPENRYIYNVTSVRIHEEYMTRGYGFDVALVKLARPVMLEAGKVWPACLPEQGNRVSIGELCYITGWGKKSSNLNSYFSKVLQEAKMPVVDYQTCAAGNAILPYAQVDDDTMLCAGYGGSSVISGCHGDSGGPFVCQENRRWVLRGAVSWGDDRCRGGSTFSVFARISSFVDWISATKEKPEQSIAIGESCRDDLPHCKKWSLAKFCGNLWYGNYMKLFCRKSCEHCTD